MTITRDKLKKESVDLLYDVAGGMLYSLGVYTFAAANTFTAGGVSGLAIIVNYLWGLPIGIVTFVFNIPLALMAYFTLGPRTILRTLRSVLVMTLITDLVFPLIPVYTGNTMLAALFCGASMGAGVALIFMRGSSTGGTDFMTLTLKKKYPHMNLGQLAFLQDTIVLIIAAVVFRNIDSILYGAVSMFVGSKVVDAILYGIDSGIVLLIVTDKQDELVKSIDAEIERGSTLIPAVGGYTRAAKTVLMVAIRKNQIGPVKRIVRECDPTAFVTAIESSEIIGEGFKPHSH